MITDNGPKKPGPSQRQGEDSLLNGLPLYLVHGDRGVIQPLNVPARNQIVHENPALVKKALATAFQRQADKKGCYEAADCVVRWKQSGIPFHIEFEISASNNTCQHLASVRNIKAKDPVSTHFCTLLTSLTEIGPVRKEPCSACKSFSKQATCKSTVMKSV